MTLTPQPGALNALLERLGLTRARERDKWGPCPYCGSSDALHAYGDSARCVCFACGAGRDTQAKQGQALAIAERVLGDRRLAKEMLVAVGLFERREPAQRAKPKNAPKIHATRARALEALLWSVAQGKPIDGYTWTIVGEYDYRRADGTLTEVVVRMEPLDAQGRRARDAKGKGNKRIASISPHPGGGWTCTQGPKPRPLYRLRELLAAPADALVVLTEGERKCDELAALLAEAGSPIVVLSWPGGAAGLDAVDFSPVAGWRLLICPDAGKVGAAAAKKLLGISSALPGGGEIAVLELPGLADGEDASDWIAARRAKGISAAEMLAELEALIAAAEWERTEKQDAQDAPEVELEPGEVAGDYEEGIRLGHRDEEGRLIVSVERARPTAQAALRELYSVLGFVALRVRRGILYAWRRGRYQRLDVEDVCAELMRWLHGAHTVRRRKRTLDFPPFPAVPRTVRSSAEALSWEAPRAPESEGVAWIGDEPAPVDPAQVYLTETGAVDLLTGHVYSPDPRWFATTCSPVVFDREAKPPTRFLGYLRDAMLGAEDLDAQIATIQEFLGALLARDARFQKILLLVGPPRSGKGVLLHLMALLVGIEAACAPSSSSLRGPFGLEPLLDRTFAAIGDARFGGEGVAQLVETLLSVSAGDRRSVERKNRNAAEVHFRILIAVATNELPSIRDSSSALATRFLCVQFTQSFLGREDPGLLDRLSEELGSIAAWAAEGYRRLRRQGRFTEGASALATREEIGELASPIRTFVRERCELGEWCRATVPQLFAAYGEWAVSSGIERGATVQRFLRDLRAAFPSVSKAREGTAKVRFVEGIALASAPPHPLEPPRKSHPGTRDRNGGEREWEERKRTPQPAIGGTRGCEGVRGGDTSASAPALSADEDAEAQLEAAYRWTPDDDTYTDPEDRADTR